VAVQIPQDDGGLVGRLADLVDKRAEKWSLGLVALENFGFVLQAPVVPDALDDAVLAAPVPVMRRW